MRPSTLTTLTLVGVLALAACGGDDDDASDTTAAVTETVTADIVTTDAAETTAAPQTTETTDGPTTSAAPAAWATAFDSTTGYDAKAAVIADAEALRPTIEAYTPAGEVVGGITLEPTDVVITGDTAAITYKVLFAGTSPYPEQEGTAQRVDGVWVVGRDEFCGFMAMARNPCS